MDDEQWESHVKQAQLKQAQLKIQEKPVAKHQSAATKANIFLALLSPACLVLSFFLPSNWAELLLLLVSGLGGLCSLGILAAYAYTDGISHKIKEATLSFVLGNLFVLFVFLLSPI